MNFQLKYSLFAFSAIASFIAHPAATAQLTTASVGRLKSENLLTNPDFMARDPEQRPLHWIFGKQLQTAVLTTEQKHGNNRDDHSLKITDTSIQLDLQVHSKKRIANPGTIYSADAWVKSASGISSAPYAIAVEGDPIDDRRVQSKGAMEAQIYGVSVHLYESVYIGFPWVSKLASYVAGEFAPSGDCPAYPELAVSRDLRHWHRTSGDPIISLVMAGSWDVGTLYTSRQFLISNEKIELYFGAMNRSHGGSSATQRQTGHIAKAVWPTDGFVSLSNGENDTGIVVTRPFLFAGDQLFVNANWSSGSLQVELLDNNGSIIPGYSRGESVVVTGDHLSKIIRWKNHADLEDFPAKMVRLKFYIKKADLYSYWFNHSLTTK